MRLEKEEARNRIKSRLKRLDKNTKEELSNRIVDRLLSLNEVQSATNFAAYMSLPEEVNLNRFISELMRRKLSISVPIATDNALKFVEIDENTEYGYGRYKILEPTFGKEKYDFDVIIVPMVSFDEERNRLGHGKGYYDRALKTNEAIKIGVAFEAQRENFICDKNDVKMDIIVTEERVIR